MFQSTALQIPHQIPYEVCRALIGDNLVNLAVVVQDEGSQDRVLAYEEFNIGTPEIDIQVRCLYRDTKPLSSLQNRKVYCQLCMKKKLMKT